MITFFSFFFGLYKFLGNCRLICCSCFHDAYNKSSLLSLAFFSILTELMGAARMNKNEHKLSITIIAALAHFVQFHEKRYISMRFCFSFYILSYLLRALPEGETKSPHAGGVTGELQDAEDAH